MSLEALDALLNAQPERAKAPTPALSPSDFVSVDEWAWNAFNGYFDANRLGKKGRKMQWAEQTEAHLEHVRKGKI
jgi:hypothetical protein